MINIEDTIEHIGYRVKLFLGNVGTTTVENTSFTIENSEFILEVTGKEKDNQRYAQVTINIQKDDDGGSFSYDYPINNSNEMENVISVINNALWNNHLV